MGEPKNQVGKKTFYSEVLISGNKVRGSSIMYILELCIFIFYCSLLDVYVQWNLPIKTLSGPGILFFMRGCPLFGG